MTLLAAPALPLHSAGKYVAGAYIVFVVMLVVYLGIMSVRTRRTRGELSQLRREVAERRAREELDGPEFPHPGPRHEGSPPVAGPEGTSPPEREPAV